MQSLPLTGCRVIDLTRALAGPYCTMILADLGADVIKVEPLRGGDMSRNWGPFADGISVYYLSVNRNKRSLAIDLRTAEGLDIIRKLAAEADALVENFKVGVTETMGLGYDQLAAENSRLVYASITGFGRGGPYEMWPGFDQIAQGMSGLMSITGSAESGPFRVGLPIADLAAGMWTAIGVLAALLHQRVTGLGQRVDTSLLGSLVGMLCVQGQRYLSLGEVATRAGNDHPVLAPYGAFESANGLLNIAVATERMWCALCHILEIDELAKHPDYLDNAARMTNRDALRLRLEERLRRRTKEEWATLCIGAGIPAGPILRIDEALDDPHVVATGCIETVNDPIFGSLRQLASPIRLGSRSGVSSRTPPPMLGGDSLDVLRSFGFPEQTIRNLLERGIVAEAEMTKRH